MTIDFRKIFTRRNRGILLDAVVFLFQLALMRVLVRLLGELIRDAQEDLTAKAGVALFCLGLCFLQPVGALLKRRRVSQRLADEDYEYQRLNNNFGCYYVVAQSVLMATAISLILAVFGRRQEYIVESFYPLLASLPFAVGNLFVVGLYLRPPERRPLLKFFASPQSEMLGDLCLFLNMILWQVLWGFLMSSRYDAGSPITEELVWLRLFLPQKNYDVIARLGLFLLSLFVFYVPPRLTYLVEEWRGKVPLLTMSLANTPVLLRVLFGRS